MSVNQWWKRRRGTSMAPSLLTCRDGPVGRWEGGIEMGTHFICAWRETLASHRTRHERQDVELVLVLVRPCMSRHQLMGWKHHVMVLCHASHGHAELVEIKEFPQELVEIVHLGRDDVLLLAAVVVLGTSWNEGGGEWVVLIIRDWHKHLMGHTGSLIRSLGGREIDCGRGVEGFRACKPNTRGLNRSDAFNNNESHWNSGDYAQGSIGATSARGEWNAKLPTEASAAD